MESIEFECTNNDDMEMMSVTDATMASAKKRKRIEENSDKGNQQQQKRIKLLENNSDNSSTSMMMDNNIIDSAQPSTSKGIKRKQVTDYCGAVDDQQSSSMEESNNSHQDSAAKRQKMEPEMLTISDISTQYPAHFKFQPVTKRKKKVQERQETIKAIHRLIFTSTKANDRSKQLNEISENQAAKEATAQVSHTSSAVNKSKTKKSSFGFMRSSVPAPSFLKLAPEHCMKWTTKSAFDAKTFEQSFQLLKQVAELFNALEMPEIASDLMQHLQSTLKKLCNSSSSEQFTVDRKIKYKMGIIKIQNRFCSKRDIKRRDVRNANVCKLIKKYLKYKNNNCISPEIESELISCIKEEAFYECDKCANLCNNKLIHDIFKFWLAKSKVKESDPLPTSFLVHAIRFVLEITQPGSISEHHQDPNHRNRVYHLDGKLNTLIHTIVDRNSNFIIDHPETAVEIAQLLTQFKIFDWDLTNKKNETVMCIFEKQFDNKSCETIKRKKNVYI